MIAARSLSTRRSEWVAHLLEAAEEAFDEVALSTAPSAESEGAFAGDPWRDVRPAAARRCRRYRRTLTPRPEAGPRHPTHALD